MFKQVFSARFDKQDEDNQVLDETDLFIRLNIIHSLTETDIHNIDILFPLENRIQKQEMKDSGWRFDKIDSLIICFHKKGELNGLFYVKVHLRRSAVLNIEIKDKYRFLWSILAKLHQCENSHPNRISNYRHFFNELNIQDFNFSNGFKCSDAHKFEKLNNLSFNISELNFHQVQHK